MQSLGRALPLRRDPAPSRWAYRMQRLWLTPLFRVTMRVGLPAFVITLAIGLYLSDQTRRDAFGQSLTAMKDKVEQRPEFLVGLLSIDGASPELADAVRARLALPLPQSSFDLDLDAVQLKAEELDAVASARVKVRSGGVLQVTITEREPAWVWRTDAGLILVDAEGHRVAGLAERADRADLPLIAGEGADKAVVEAALILQAAAPLLPRLRGLVRISDRRWTLVLDRDQSILLPADNPVDALEGLLALNQAEDLLARDLTSIDLRNEHRPVLRLAPFALGELRRAQGIAPTESKT
jgi:cell division protein FtsQ